MTLLLISLNFYGPRVFFFPCYLYIQTLVYIGISFGSMYSISNKLEYLSNFGVQESYKGKGSEWLRYKDISDLAKLGKIFTQIIRSHVFSTSTNKHFTWNLWIISFLQWTWYMISKQKIYIIHVIQLSSIYYYSMLPNCNSPIFIMIRKLFFQVKGASCLL